MNPIDQLKAAYERDFGTAMPITSGARTTEEQARLYADRANNKNPVAPPGTSKHESASAIDISNVNPRWMEQQGWHRPHANDPVHWEPKQMAQQEQKQGKTVVTPSGKRIVFEGNPSTEEIDTVMNELYESQPDLFKEPKEAISSTWDADSKKSIASQAVEGVKNATGYSKLSNTEKMIATPVAGLAAYGTAKAVPAVTNAVKSFAASPFAKPVAGASMVLQGDQAMTALRNKDYERAAGYGLGAIGSGVAAAVPHPLAKVLGGAIGLAGPAAGEYFGKSEDELKKRRMSQ